MGSLFSGDEARLGVSLAFFVISCHQGNDARSAVCSDRRCSARALVNVLAGDKMGEAKPICSGIVIGGDDATTRVLTAAHCGARKRNGAKRLFARVACDSRRTLTVESVERHPSFRPGDADTAYDFAILTMPRVSCAARVEFTAEPPSPGAELRVPVDGDWAALTLTTITPLRLKLGRKDRGVCRGSSGAPVFTEQQGRLRLAAIVASGRDDCQGDIVAGRIDAFAGRLAASPRTGRVFADASPATCAQCQEQQALGAGSCGNADTQCSDDHVCSDARACLQACQTAACERQCLAVGAGSPALSALRRCACAKCAEPCAATCAPSALRALDSR
jgi:hypothetical protein